MKKLYLFFTTTMCLSVFFISYFDFSYGSQPKNEYKRAPASASSLEKDIDKVYMEVSNPDIFNEKNCVPYLTEITDFLLVKGSQTYLPQSKDDYAVLLERSHKIVQKIFYLRLKLRERFIDMSSEKDVDKQCVNLVRKSFRYARFLEEFITEIGVKTIAANKSTHLFDAQDFSDTKYQLYLNPKYEELEFMSGDILMVRASSFVSATIARIGDEDGQFSHAAMIYVDGGVPYVIESLIESGVGIMALSEWRKSHHVRTVLFRSQDHGLASRAAEKLYEVSKERVANKKPVPYDFTMNTQEHSEIFCAEIIQWAFDMVTDGKSLIPRYETEFQLFAKHPFLKQLTIDVSKTFSPNDLEVEPTIELVAEWRNFEGTRLRRVQDVVLTSMMSWMSDKNYILKGTSRSFTMTNIAWVGRKLFGFKKDQIPPNMPYGFLKTFMKLEKVSNTLETYLSDLEEEFFEKTGYSMDYATMLIVMEKLRIEDCRTFQIREQEWEDSLHSGELVPALSRKSLFHHMFNTKNSKCE